MKNYKIITVITTILAIVLIMLMSFLGIYKQKEYKIENIVPEYLLGMEFTGGVAIIFESKETSEEALTEENFEKSKSIISKRLSQLGAKEYNIRQEKGTGKITVEIPDDVNSEVIINTIVQNGKFEMIDKETNEVLMDNSNISSAIAMPVQGDMGTGTSIYLQIKFNKEGKKKLEEISSKYVATTNEDGTEEKKEVTIMYNDSEFVTTYFADTMSNGLLSIIVGSGTDSEVLTEYMKQGTAIAIALNTGKMPIEYNVTAENVVPMVEESLVRNYIYTIGAVVIIALSILVVKFKLNAIYSIILQIGYISALLLLIRVTNVVVTMGGIMAIAISIGVNYIAQYMLLNEIVKNGEKVKEAIIKCTKKLSAKSIPLYIVAIIFSFGQANIVSSFGMVLVWGIILLYVYNLVFTKPLIQNVIKK